MEIDVVRPYPRVATIIDSSGKEMVKSREDVTEEAALLQKMLGALIRASANETISAAGLPQFFKDITRHVAFLYCGNVRPSSNLEVSVAPS